LPILSADPELRDHSAAVERFASDSDWRRILHDDSSPGVSEPMKRTPTIRPAHGPARDERPPGSRALNAARRDASSCQRCGLWKNATQTVFGAGAANAPIMIVGEQPGDQEDREGQPFVGPAGRLLREALTRAGLDVTGIYLTNVVKHFKWRPRGKRRIHERPNHEEVMACRLWLDLEIQHVRPRIIIGLGATAARALLGPSVRVTRDRAKRFSTSFAEIVTVTVHPSSILRAIDSSARAEALERFILDLRTIAGWSHTSRLTAPAAHLNAPLSVQNPRTRPRRGKSE
jgi:uracil-DNA glycosylase family protein